MFRTGAPDPPASFLRGRGMYIAFLSLGWHAMCRKQLRGVLHPRTGRECYDGGPGGTAFLSMRVAIHLGEKVSRLSSFIHRNHRRQLSIQMPTQQVYVRCYRLARTALLSCVWRYEWRCM